MLVIHRKDGGCHSGENLNRDRIPPIYCDRKNNYDRNLSHQNFQIINEKLGREIVRGGRLSSYGGSPSSVCLFPALRSTKNIKVSYKLVVMIRGLSYIT